MYVTYFQNIRVCADECETVNVDSDMLHKYFRQFKKLTIYSFI